MLPCALLTVEAQDLNVSVFTLVLTMKTRRRYIDKIEVPTAVSRVNVEMHLLCRTRGGDVIRYVA